LARNEEGEFELILGNRQLISVFLIVVILLAVFFSMGYIVGRNSGPIASSESARNEPGKAIVVERPGAAPQSAAPASQEPAGAPAETKPAPSEPAATHPEQPASPPAKETKAPQPKPQASQPAARASVTNEPATGEYWQVVATSRPDAEIISEALNKKGFHSLVAPGPKENLFRVLVGPLKDAAAAQTRADLEASGFKNPIMRRY